DIRKVQLESEIARGKSNPQVGKDADAKGIDTATAEEAKATLRENLNYLNQLQRRLNANISNKPGSFTISAPRTGIILSADFRENLLGRNVKPGDPLIRVG